MVPAKWLVGLLVLLTAGCATYDQRLRAAHEDYYSGRVVEAEAALRALAGSAAANDRTLLQLELASVLQAQGRFDEAARLLSEADDGLELLDYTSAPIDEMIEFAFAVDDVWRASPPERLMINTQNMINYLGAGALEDAAVEARRLMILLSQSDLSDDELYANAFGWGLAGVILAASRDFEEAQDAFSHVPADSALRPSERAAGKGTILVVCQLGQAPIRRQATYWLTSGDSPHQLNIPVLQARPGGAVSASVSVDGSSRGEVPQLFDLGEHLLRRYDDEFPRLVAAALAQVVPRAIGAKIVGDAVAESMAEGAKTKEDVAASVAVGAFVGFLAESAAAAVQVADVRCWSMLPGRYGAMRLDVEPGGHAVSVSLAGSGASVEVSVDVAAGELVLVNVVSGPGDGYRRLPDPRGRDLTDQPEGLAALELLEQASWLNHEID